MSIKTKLLLVFIIVTLSSLGIATLYAWLQINMLGNDLRDIAVNDSMTALNATTAESKEKIAANVAMQVANFLYERDQDIEYLAASDISEATLKAAISRTGRITMPVKWVLSDDGTGWVRQDSSGSTDNLTASNVLNTQINGLRTTPLSTFTFKNVPLFDEVTFIDVDGHELMKFVTNATKTRHPLSYAKRDVSKKENTYLESETYFEQLTKLRPGEIYVSDLIGAYTPTNFVGMYTPAALEQASKSLDRPLTYAPERQAYAGKENPNGIHFEGIIRWGTPVMKNGQRIGYVTLALNHDHLLELINHISATGAGYTDQSSANDGNYVAMWDHLSHNIAHPRHSMIYGIDTKNKVMRGDCIDKDVIREHQGLTEIIENGGSSSFYTSTKDGLFVMTSASTIPYFTGRFAPSAKNSYSRRGFGLITMNTLMEEIEAPAVQTGHKIMDEVEDHTALAIWQLIFMAGCLFLIIMMFAFGIAEYISRKMKVLEDGMTRFRHGELHFRFETQDNDELDLLAGAFNMMADNISNNFNNLMTIIDLEGNIIHMNHIALDYLGKQIDEVLGRKYEDVSLYPKDSVYDPLWAMRNHKEAEVFYMSQLNCYLKPKATPLISDGGQQIGYFIESVDVSDLRKIQIELERATNAANAANRHKSEFLSRMSHEFRTPMNAIIGLSGIVKKRVETIENADLRGDMFAFIEKIEASSQKLLSMLNDVLEISSLDSGEIELIEEQSAISAMIEAISRLIGPKCEEKAITFTNTTKGLDGIVCSFDRLRLRQVITQLLDNAVKFTPDGGEVKFISEKKDERDGKVLVRFCVEDTGVGFSDTIRDELFDPFEQSVEGIVHISGGAGLGLAISRRVIDLFNSEIVAENIETGGARFSFEVWLKISADDDIEPIDIDDLTDMLTGKKMLLVDDIEVNRVIVTSILEDTGLEIDEAEDGVEAVSMFDESNIGEYDMILMDIQMPKMDGHTASLEIRNLERKDALSVPIVALSANSFREDIQKSMECKMNYHLAKPIDAAQLAGVLVRYLKIKL